MIRYIRGDATAPEADGNKVLVHVCNDMGAWGAGFVLAISKRWPEPERAYREWAARCPKQTVETTVGMSTLPMMPLGEAQFVKVEDDTWVANMIGQHLVWGVGGRPPIWYDAVRAALRRVAMFALGSTASIHMPRIGCGLAGGEWRIMGEIVEAELGHLSVTVYDWP